MTFTVTEPEPANFAAPSAQPTATVFAVLSLSLSFADPLYALSALTEMPSASMVFSFFASPESDALTSESFTMTATDAPTAVFEIAPVPTPIVALL